MHRLIMKAKVEAEAFYWTAWRDYTRHHTINSTLDAERLAQGIVKIHEKWLQREMENEHRA